MPKNWIKKAIKHPGSLRETAKREGLIKGDEKLSQSDLSKLSKKAEKTGNKTLSKKVNLAKTLKKMH